MGKINVYNKIVMKNKKKRKYGNQRNLYINLHLKKILEWNLQLATAYHTPLLISELFMEATP